MTLADDSTVHFTPDLFNETITLEDGSVTRRDAEGVIISQVATDGFLTTWEHLSDGRARLTGSDGSVETRRTDGTRQSMALPDGRTQVYGTDGVTLTSEFTASGVVLTFDGNGGRVYDTPNGYHTTIDASNVATTVDTLHENASVPTTYDPATQSVTSGPVAGQTGIQRLNADLTLDGLAVALALPSQPLVEVLEPPRSPARVVGGLGGSPSEGL